MILWFAALSFAAVFLVFDSPLLDYRLVVAGSLLPLADLIWGSPWPLHSIVVQVGVMTLVMVGGWGKRLTQRRWLGVPIGMMLHAGLSGVWRNRAVFWWPVFGRPDEPFALPQLRWLILAELIGLAVAVWLVRRLSLREASVRARLVATGHIDRSVMRR